MVYRKDLEAELLDFVSWMKSKGFEIAKNRRLRCGEYVWLPISDLSYEIEPENIVRAYLLGSQGAC